MKTALLLSLLIAPATATASFPNVSGCSSHVKKNIEAIHDDIGTHLRELNDAKYGISRFSFTNIRDAILIPEGRVPSPRYKRHEDTYRVFHSKVSQVLRQMQRKHASGYGYSCSKSHEGGCKGGAYGYVKFFFNRPLNTIYFCPSFWDMGHKDQLRTVFHELSHLAASTTDDLGNLFTDQGMMSQANEAYFYEAMVDGDIDTFFKIRSWGLLWVKPRKAQLFYDFF